VQEQQATLLADAAKAAPPVALTGWQMLGLNLNELLALVTLVYTLLLITHHVWTKWIAPFRAARKRRPRRRRHNFTNDDDEEAA
jgi:uncharacterized membrane-anchored protein